MIKCDIQVDDREKISKKSECFYKTNAISMNV